MRLRRGWIFEQHRFYTPLTAREAAEKLGVELYLQPKSLFAPAPPAHKRFRGQASDQNFSIEEIIRGRNSFLPILTGHFHPQARGTELLVMVRPAAFSTAFISIWLLGTTAAFAFLASWYLFGPSQTVSPIAIWPLFVPLFMMIVGAILIYAGFYTRIQQNIDWLKQTLLLTDDLLQ